MSAPLNRYGADEPIKCLQESITSYRIYVALRERLERTKRARPTALKDEILRIGRECAALPELDARTADEILAYGRDGLPR